MKRDSTAQMPLLIISGAILLILLGLLELPAALLRPAAVGLGTAILLLTLLWKRRQERRESEFANSVCETLDALMNSREPENYRPYEDSQLSKVQGKLLQYHDRTQAGRRQSKADKQTLQELVSDISPPGKNSHGQYPDVHRHPAPAGAAGGKAGPNGDVHQQAGGSLGGS